MLTMLRKKPVLMNVEREVFEAELLPLNEEEQTSIAEYIAQNQNTIKVFEFGHVPGERVFRVTHADGTTMQWDMVRRRRHRSRLKRFFQ